MKKMAIFLYCILLALAFSTNAMAAEVCTTIQDGTLLTSAGEVIVPGFDKWGYNYQAHIFSGGYCDSYRNAEWCQPWKDVELVMKWNDAWLSNKDCTSDSLLDRHYGFGTYIGSGAWETNHMKGSYELNGKTCKWVDFVKIIAVPLDAHYIDLNNNGKPDDYVEYWYTSDAKEIGASIWGAFAIIEEVYNDPCAGFHGKLYGSPDHSGFGGW